LTPIIDFDLQRGVAIALLISTLALTHRAIFKRHNRGLTFFRSGSLYGCPRSSFGPPWSVMPLPGAA
jgi:hypothetical protein